MTPTIIYICFKREDDFYQVLFSIFSIEKHTSYFSQKDHKIVIYTDNAEFFKTYLDSAQHNISYVQLSESELFELKGGSNFQMVFRVKLKLIEHSILSTTNSVLYLDADTFFVKDFINNITNDKAYSAFHCDEGLIYGRKTKETSWNIMSKYEKYFEDIKNVRMYNAGLIWVHRDNLHLVQSAIKKLDAIYPLTNFYFLEQLLISYELQKNTKIITFEKVVNHYWYIKEFTKKIKEFVKNQSKYCLAKCAIEKLPIENVPMEKEFRSIWYQWPYKIRRKLYQWGLISSINKF